MLNPGQSPPAGLSACQIEAINRPIAEAAGLPNESYTRAEFLALERERLFSRHWSCIGFGSDLPEKNYALPASLLGLPLLVVRDRDDAIRVFHNVCSHRGHKLVAQPGRVPNVLRCPYHSWTYAMDGKLRGTPHIGGVGIHRAEGFDRGRHGLRPVRSAVWFGLIFVDLSGEAPPFAEHIAPLAERWQVFWGADGPGMLHAAGTDGRLEMELRANWKLPVENYCESYHLPWIHPGLNGYSRLEDHYHIFGDERFSGQGSVAYNLAAAVHIDLPGLPGWPQDKLRHAEYVSLYPNVLLGLQVDHAFALLVEPLAPDLSRERLQVYYVGEATARSAQYAGIRKTVLESWRSVFQEDVGAVEGMQQGRLSPAFGGGVFSPVMDTPTHHFHRWVANRLAA